MTEPFRHVAWAHAVTGCPMRYYVDGSGDVVFCFGGNREPFEFSFDRPALERWLRLGSEALAELERPAGNGQLVAQDQEWPVDNALMAGLSSLNTALARYIVRYLDADAGRAEPVSVADERALSERLATSAAAVRARAERHAVLGGLPLTIEPTR